MFEVIFREIAEMTVNNMANMGMLMLFAWFISQYAKSSTPKFMMSILGLFFIVSALKTDSILFNPSTFFGLGLLLPHLVFFMRWIVSVIATLKLITFDSYYFFLTVYYKTRNMFFWFIEFYEKIQGFFYKKKNRKSYNEHYSDKGYSYKEKFNQEEKKQEQSYSYEEKSYHEETKQEQSSSHKDSKHEEPYSQSTNDYTEEKSYDPKYAQFYSSSSYVVLGVSASDDMKTIKANWRKLMKEYHSDKHYKKSPEELKLYTEITQLINNAYDELKKVKK